MYANGWEIILPLDYNFPTPEAATLILKRLIHDGLVRKCPLVFGPQSEEINGNKTPICRETDALTSL